MSSHGVRGFNLDLPRSVAATEGDRARTSWEDFNASSPGRETVAACRLRGTSTVLCVRGEHCRHHELSGRSSPSSAAEQAKPHQQHAVGRGLRYCCQQRDITRSKACGHRVRGVCDTRHTVRVNKERVSDQKCRYEEVVVRTHTKGDTTAVGKRTTRGFNG